MNEQVIEAAAREADKYAAECEQKAKQYPEHTLKFVRDCAVAQTIASRIRALARPEAEER